MEAVTACVSKLGGYVTEAAINEARYMLCFDSIYDDLKEEENKLKSEKDRIKDQLEREKKNTKEIEKDVKKWLDDVDNVMADVQKLIKEIEAKNRCFNGFCPNWYWRYFLGKKAKQTTSLMLKLRNSGKFSTVAHPKPLPGIEFSVPSDFMFFEATKRASYQVSEALKDEKTKMVGLYGSGGAGKTTLAKIVGDKLRQQKIFDEVVIAVVSQHPNFIDVQNQLAESLGLKLEEVTKKERAKRLYLRFTERFTETKSKILVVLDDVWKKLDLKNELGIPVDGDHNGCKILLTTRREQVCDMMECNSRIQLGILNPEEGLALLKKYARIDDVDESTLTDVAKEVAGECKGLPLAIAAVGSALVGRDVDEWKVVSRKLKTAKLIDVDDIDVDVYSCLKLSYDYLKGEDSKLYFLLCSLFPEDRKIELEVLLRYGMGLGCYQGVESIEEARSLLRGTIKGLKASSLLLHVDDINMDGIIRDAVFVKMHDIVRDAAIWIGSKEEKKERKFYSKAGFGLTKWPEDEGMKQYTGISLVGNSIAVLPNGLECPNLHILILGDEDKGHKFDVPDQFFEGMKELKVVTIIGGKLSLKSLQFLTKLRVLQLIDCHVRDIAFLEKLKTMQILCFEGTSYSKDIPTDLGDKLNNFNELTYLELKSCEDLECIMDALQLEKSWNRVMLSRLATLYLLDLPKLQWIWKAPTQHVSLQNLTEMKVSYCNKLTHLFTLSQVRSLKQLKSLYVEYCEILEYIVDAKFDENEREINVIGEYEKNIPLPMLRELKLLVLPNLFSFYSENYYSTWQALQELDLWDCPHLNTIADVQPSVHCFVEPEKSWNRLVTLYLDGLEELQWIWKAPAQYISLQHLTAVDVIKCHNLTHLFSLSQARSLKQLKRLCVEDCERLECIVETKSDDNEREINVIGEDEKNIALPMLRQLRLENLPNLVSFCSGNYYSTWQALKMLNVSGCPHLNVSAELQASVHYFVENLQTLSVDKCPHVYGAISAQMKHGFKSLEILLITEVGVQVVFLQQEAIMGGDGQESKLFPSLKELQLQCLPELEVLYKGTTHTFSLQNLTILHVDECNKLRYLLSPTLAQNLLQLNELQIDNCSELEQIIDDSEDITSFPKLRQLYVLSCPKIKRLFHISVAPSLEKLEQLWICDNDELVEVFWQKDGADIVDVKKFVITQLRRLEIWDSPKLTNFCPEGYQFTCSSLSDIYCKNEAQQISWTKGCSAEFPWEPFPGLQILSVKK